MDNPPITPSKARRAASALNRVRELLQRAHFAAREFEDEMPARRFLEAELLTDCIHRVRRSAESLAFELQPGGASRN